MPRTPQSELAGLIVKCRTERGLSLAKMAKALRLSAAGLSKIERGLVEPNRTTRAKIAAFLERHGYFPKVAA